MYLRRINTLYLSGAFQTLIKAGQLHAWCRCVGSFVLEDAGRRHTGQHRVHAAADERTRRSSADHEQNHRLPLTLFHYTMNRKKRGSTYVIITLENTLDFYDFCTVVNTEETFYTHMKNMSTSPKHVLTLPCES